jgi:hypothetical protein
MLVVSNTTDPMDPPIRPLRSNPPLPALAAMAGGAADIKVADAGHLAPAARLHDTRAEGSAPWDCGDNDDGRNRHGSLVGGSKRQTDRVHLLSISKRLETREKENAREVTSTGFP